MRESIRRSGLACLNKMSPQLNYRRANRDRILVQERAVRAARKLDPILYAADKARWKAQRDSHKERIEGYIKKRSERLLTDPVYRAECHAKSKAHDEKRGEMQSEKQRLKNHTLRKDALLKLGGVCIVCGFNDPRALQIDHVNGGGTAERLATGRCQNTIHKFVLEDTVGKYQLLCANCNWIKRHTNGEFSRKYNYLPKGVSHEQT